MITCKRAAELMSKSFDQKLSIKEFLSLKFHNFICLFCRRFLQQIGIIKTALSEKFEVQNQTSRDSTKLQIKALLKNKIEDK